jgi:hypothetical protein
LLTSVFCTSTSTATDASTRASSSTTSVDMKNVAPAPPYCSGISTPMIPSSKHLSISARDLGVLVHLGDERAHLLLGELAHLLAEHRLVLGQVGEGQAASRGSSDIVSPQVGSKA